MSSSVQFVAHRGGSALAPENTLAAFRNALSLPNVNAIELDVHMSRDGHAIVFHDNTLEKRTDGSGNILDVDFAYLRSLNAATHFPGGWKGRQQIPTLREVLDLARGRTQVYIEIKTSKRDGVHGQYPGILEATLEEIDRARMLNDVLLISFDWTLLPLIKSLEARARTGALVSNDTWNSRAENAFDTLCQQVLSLGCSWINMDRRLFIDGMPQVLHGNGLKLGLWTINTEDEMRRCISSGVDSITSDRPDLFSKL